jgi:hypothetical protein
MTALAIDTLRYMKRLKAAGFTEEQAEVQAEALAEAIRDTLVTKIDLVDTETRLRLEIRDLHTNLIRWLVPLMIGQTAIVAAMVKLL